MGSGHPLLSLRVGLRGLLMSCGVWAVLFTTAGFLGGFWWIFDICSHFRVQYLVALIILIPLALVGGARRSAALFGLAAVANAAALYHAGYFAKPERPVSEALTVVAANVHTANRRHDEVVNWIRSKDADIAIIQEIDDGWVQSLAVLTNEMPHMISVPRDDNFGIAMLSRLPLTRPSVEYLGEGWVPQVVAIVEHDGGPILVVGVHTMPPRSEFGTYLRDDMLEAIAGLVTGLNGPAIVAGDLNAAPWSPRLRHFALSRGLHGASMLPTWPVPLPAIARVPLDHVLATEGLVVYDHEIGPDIGSDHRPLVVKVARRR